MRYLDLSLRMREAIDYRQRVDQCIVRAEAMADPTDRARWLQLAERWALLSQLQFHSRSAAWSEPAGLWRDSRWLANPSRAFNQRPAQLTRILRSCSGTRA